MFQLIPFSTPGIHVDPHTLCEIFYNVSLFFCQISAICHPLYVIVATKYHLLGNAPKTCAYNFALTSAYGPRTSILKHNAGMGLIAYLLKFVAWYIIAVTSLQKEAVINV